ncbi:MAG TPA: dienelactone hydrolase family protein [Phenylobacterium sp.]
MCDDDIHQGLVQDPTVSRRAFGLMSVAAAGVATSAAAQSTAMEMDVSVKTPDGTCDAVLFHPAKAGAYPGVLIWTDILGLRPVFREMGRRLAGEGYTVLVPNPFYRVAKAPVVDGAFDFNNPADRAKLGPMRASLTPEGVDRDARAFVAFLDAQKMTDKKARIGVQGYCMGGPLSVRTAAAVPDRIGAVGSFHGGGLVTADPTSPHLLIAKTKASYLVAIADNDDQKEPAAKDTLKAALAAAKRPATVEVYKGANHGWCVKGSQVYNEPAAEKAWSELLALYKTALV